MKHLVLETKKPFHCGKIGGKKLHIRVLAQLYKRFAELNLRGRVLIRPHHFFDDFSPFRGGDLVALLMEQFELEGEFPGYLVEFEVNDSIDYV